jgi:sugar phosphate permease
VAFAACGALGLIWAAIWLAWFRGHSGASLDGSGGDQPASLEHSPSENAPTPASLREILRSRAFWGLVVATSFLNPLQYFYTTWLPRYFEKYAGVGFGKELAARLVLVYLALDLGLWIGGAGVIALARRWGVTRSRLMVAAVGTIGMMAIPAVSRLGSLNAITSILCAATFGLGCFMVNYLSFVSEVSTTRVSTAAGLLGGIGSLTGAGFMLLVGETVEHTRGFDRAFLFTGAMPLIAFAGIWLSCSRVRDLAAGVSPAPELH